MKLRKILLLLIISSMIIFTTSCGGDDSQSGQSFPTEPIEIVSMGIVDSMDCFKDETKNSTMNLSSYIGLNKEDLEKPQVQINLDLETEDGIATLFYKALQNDSSDKASVSLGLSSDGQEAETSVTFSGNEMIMSFFTVEEPMVKYTSDFSASKGMNPFDRYVNALQLGNSLVFEDTWSSDISKLSSDINANLTSENVAVTDGTVLYHGVDVESKVYTLTADESTAGTLLKDLYNAMYNDEDVNSYLTAMENSDGLNTLKSVAAVVNDEGKLAQTKLTAVVYVQEETFLACDMYFQTPNGNFNIENNYYMNGSDRHIVSKVLFPAGVTLTNTHTVYDQGDNTREDNMTFEMNVEGSNEPLKIVSNNMITEKGDNYKKDFNITYSGVEDDGSSSMGNMAGTYEAVTSGNDVNGNFTGTYTSNDPEEGEQTMNYTGTAVMSESSPEIIVPEFIEGSGVMFSDVDKLKAYLNQDGESPTTGIDNQFEQKSTAIMWMLRFNF